MRALHLCFILAFAGVGASALATEQPTQPVPDAESRPGETLTDRLDRTDGVIKPPPVDAPMQVAPPEGTSNMPVLKPEETPRQDRPPDDAGK